MSTPSKFEQFGTDPQEWAGAFAQRFAVAVSAEHGFVDTKAVMSAWFHAFAHALYEEERRRARERLREVLETVAANSALP